MLRLTLASLARASALCIIFTEATASSPRACGRGFPRAAAAPRAATESRVPVAALGSPAAAGAAPAAS